MWGTVCFQTPSLSFSSGPDPPGCRGVRGKGLPGAFLLDRPSTREARLEFCHRPISAVPHAAQVHAAQGLRPDRDCRTLASLHGSWWSTSCFTVTPHSSPCCLFLCPFPLLSYAWRPSGLLYKQISKYRAKCQSPPRAVFRFPVPFSCTPPSPSHKHLVLGGKTPLVPQKTPHCAHFENSLPSAPLLHPGHGGRVGKWPVLKGWAQALQEGHYLQRLSESLSSVCDLSHQFLRNRTFSIHYPPTH